MTLSRGDLNMSIKNMISWYGIVCNVAFMGVLMIWHTTTFVQWMAYGTMILGAIGLSIFWIQILIVRGRWETLIDHFQESGACVNVVATQCLLSGVSCLFIYNLVGAVIPTTIYLLLATPLWGTEIVALLKASDPGSKGGGSFAGA